MQKSITSTARLKIDSILVSNKMKFFGVKMKCLDETHEQRIPLMKLETEENQSSLSVTVKRQSSLAILSSLSDGG